MSETKTPLASPKAFVDGTKHYANKSFRNKVFTGDLSNADFRNAELIEAVFDGCDLTGAKFNQANCWGASFKRARLYKANFAQATLSNANFEAADLRGITLTMTCETFENVKLPKKWYGALLFMLSITDIPVETQKALEAIIGEEEFKIWQTVRMRI